MAELKSCPFCGGEAVQKAEYVGTSKASFVKCKVCGSRIPGILVSDEYCSKDEAKKAWNRRADNEREERSKGHQWKLTLAELPKSEENVLLYWCGSGTMSVGFALYENDEPVSWCAYVGEWYTDCDSNPDLWMQLPARPLKGADNDN